MRPVIGNAGLKSRSKATKPALPRGHPGSASQFARADFVTLDRGFNPALDAGVTEEEIDEY